MEEVPRVSRRGFLSTTCASLGGLGGCFSREASTSREDRPAFNFAGVIISTRPSVEPYLPLDVDFGVSHRDDQLHQETRSVEGPIHGMAFLFSPDWLQPETSYTVTVSTPIHDAVSISTEEVSEGLSSHFTTDEVYFEFKLHKLGIYFNPISA